MKKLSAQQINHFHTRVIDWFQLNGRKNLPWQKPASPYRVWVSEVMLQQTQVETVIPYFEQFIKAFPSVKTLANASLDEVLHLWSGLGYYARARNLHKSAVLLCDKHRGKLPASVESLQQLSGIGRSTAGAIRSLAFGKAAAILDGNLKRVLARHYRVKGWPGKSPVLKQLWELSEQLTPKTASANYNQAMMDIGSLVCRRSNPDCDNCPLKTTCQAKKHGDVSFFPEKKPSKTKPVKQQTFYLIINPKKELLLYKRPPVGIWGGLWCLPDEAQITAAGMQIQNTAKITKFTHQFSHFTLQATVFSATSHNPNEVMDSPNWSWYDLHNPAKVGMPAPLITVLKDYKKTL